MLARATMCLRRGVVNCRRWSAAPLARVAAGPGSAEAPGQAKTPFYRWLDQVAFPVEPFPVCSLYVKPGEHDLEFLDTVKDTGCIIDSPWITMASPLIGFDAQATTDAVLEVAALPEDSRGKPVIAIVRGMGGGKTRALESVRRLMLRRDGVLPLAITFNNNTHLDNDLWLEAAIKTGSDDAIRSAYAVSLAARMASAVFGVEYDAVAAHVRSSLPPLSCSSSPKVMIRDTVRFLVDRVNAARAPPVIAISTVVVILDENRKMNDYTNSSTDFGSIARTALLDQPIAPGLRAALVISDLGYLSIDLKSDFGREVMILELPARLCPARVVNEWWGRSSTRNLTAETRSVLELAAATMNNMPRALEVADEFLRRDEDPERDPKRDPKRSVDSALLLKMFQYVFKRAEGKYSPGAPSNEVLSAMFFREAVSLDEKILHSITRSVVTNSIKKITRSTTLVPEASLVLLKVLSTDSDASTYVKLIGEGVSSVINVLAPDPDTNKPRPMGDVLEEAGLQALRSRLVLARFAGDMTLARLCGVGGQSLRDGLSVALQKDDFENEVNVATAAVMFAPLRPARYDGAVDRLRACSQGTQANVLAFLAELDALVVDDNRPVRLIRSAESESWDMCVKARDPATGGAFLVFFDDKSSAEFDDKSSAEVKEASRQQNSQRTRSSTPTPRPSWVPRAPFSTSTAARTRTCRRECFPP